MRWPGQPAGIAIDREIEVDHIQAQQFVADGASDDPGALPAQCRARRFQRGPHSGRGSRGTRAVIPQVTS